MKIGDIRLGFEYELEGITDDVDELDDTPARWRATLDHTLRNAGVEFISDPIPLDHCQSVVDDLLTHIINEYDYEISHRCSQHIHISLDGLKAQQRLALYMLLVSQEEFFFSFSPERKRNHYCTPLLYTPAFFDGLARVSCSPDWYEGTHHHCEPLLDLYLAETNCKYVSVNVNPGLHHSFGTFELRHFSPLMKIKDVEAVVDGIRTLLDIAHNAPSDDVQSMCDYLLNEYDCEELQWCVNAVRAASGNGWPDRGKKKKKRTKLFTDVELTSRPEMEVRSIESPFISSSEWATINSSLNSLPTISGE